MLGDQKLILTLQRAGSIVDEVDKRPGYEIGGDSRERTKLGMTSGKRPTSICTTRRRLHKLHFRLLSVAQKRHGLIPLYPCC